MAENLKEKTAKGLYWGALGNGAQQLLNLVFGIFLARLLTPDDYGMIGMIMIFSLIAGTFVECGFTSALAKKKDVQHNDYNAVFWFSMIVSIFIYVVLFFAAPYIALFYHQPDLVPLSRFLFLGFVISGMAVVPNALFYRQLKVKQKTLAQTLVCHWHHHGIPRHVILGHCNSEYSVCPCLRHLYVALRSLETIVAY